MPMHILEQIVQSWEARFLALLIGLAVVEKVRRWSEK